MPLKIGKYILPNFAAAVRHVKRTKPEVKDVAGYVAAIEAKQKPKKESKPKK